jgi:dephospho-CoA kinase
MKLALTGVSGAGKDHMVSLLVQSGFVRYSFSDQLKEVACSIFPWLEKDYPPIVKEQPLSISTKFEEITMSPREIWLTINKLREIEDSIFVRMLDDKISKQNGDFVISDVRSDFEYEYCKQEGYTIIFVEPSKRIYKESGMDSLVQTRKNECIVFENNFDADSEIRFLELINSIKGTQTNV